jgi:hypothetical protein
MTGLQLHQGFKRLAIVVAAMPLLGGGMVLAFLGDASVQESSRNAVDLAILSVGTYLLFRAAGSGLAFLLGPRQMSDRHEYVAGFIGFWCGHFSTTLLLKFINDHTVFLAGPEDLKPAALVPMLVAAVYLLCLLMRSASLKAFGRPKFLSSYSAKSFIRLLAVFFAIGWSCAGFLVAAWGINMRDSSIVLNGLAIAVGSPLAVFLIARTVIWVLDGFEGDAPPSPDREWYPSKRVILIAMLIGIALTFGFNRLIAGSFWKVPQCHKAISVEAHSQVDAERAWTAKVRSEFGDEFADSGVRLFSSSVCRNGTCRFSARPCILGSFGS